MTEHQTVYPKKLIGLLGFFLMSMMEFQLMSAVAVQDEPFLYEYDLKNENARKSLLKFSKQSSQGVIFDPQLVGDTKTNRVKGKMTPNEALEAMLKNTSLGYDLDAESGVFVIFRSESANSGQANESSGSPPNSQTNGNPKQHTGNVMIKKKSFLGKLVAGLSGLIVASNTPQTVAQDDAVIDEDIYQLSPFVIQEDDDIGYYASNAISATRVNESLINLPISVNVVTLEFIEDTASHTLEDALEFTAGVNPNGFGNSNFAVRGFTAGVASRDGMRGMVDAEIPISGVERVEVVKGPAALLYGQGTAGGVVNYNTKKPLDVERHKIGVTTGSWNQFRTEIDFTGPLTSGENSDWKVLYRVAGHYLDRNSWLDHAGLEEEAIHPSISFIYNNNTRIDLQYSYHRYNNLGHPEAVAAARQVPITDPVFAGRIDIERLRSELPEDVFNGLRASPGYYEEISDSYNPNPPEARINRESNTFTLTISHQFNEFVSLRTMAGFYGHRNFNYQRIGSQENAVGLVSQQGALRWVEDENYNIQTDLSIRGNLGDWGRHQIVLGHLYVDTMNKFELYRNTGLTFPLDRDPIFPDDYQIGDASTLIAGEAFLIDGPGTSSVGNSDFNLFVRNRYREASRHALYVIDKIDLFNDKFSIFAGMRIESINGKFVEFLREPFFDGEGLRSETPNDNQNSENLAQLAISYSPTQNLTFYAMMSESFQPNASFPDDPQEGEGIDIGLKFTALDGKLNGRIAYFDIELSNVQRNDLSNPDPELRGDAVLTKGEGSSGFEMDLYYTPFNRAQLIFSYAYIDSEVLDNPQFPDLVGAPLVNTPETEFNLFGTYRFSDKQGEGLRVGGGLSYRSEMRTFASGTRRHIYNPEINRLDLFVDYAQTLNNGNTVVYKLNLKNVTDELYILSQKWAPGFNWLASVTYEF